MLRRSPDYTKPRNGLHTPLMFLTAGWGKCLSTLVSLATYESSNAQAVTFERHNPGAASMKSLCQRSQATATRCLELGGVQVRFHLRHPASELRTRFSVRPAGEAVVQTVADVADSNSRWRDNSGQLF